MRNAGLLITEQQFTAGMEPLAWIACRNAAAGRAFRKARSVYSSLSHRLMADKTVEEKVKNIIVEQLGVNPEQVTPTASFIEDLGADSLDTVELVMAFEEEFSIEVPDEDAEKLQTVGDVIKYVEEKSNKA